MFAKFAAILLMFFGEALSIEAELVASKRITADGAKVLSIYLPTFALITLGGALLVAGYMIGFLHLKNIWIVTAISVGSILIVEPVLAWFMFHQTPTPGSAIGLALGALGILASLFF